MPLRLLAIIESLKNVPSVSDAVSYEKVTQMFSQTIPLNLGDVWSIAYTSDGQRIALAAKQYTLLIEGDSMLSLFDDLDEAVVNLAFSPDGRYLVAGASNGALYSFDWQSHQTYKIGQAPRTIEKIDTSLWPLVMVASYLFIEVWHAETHQLIQQTAHPDGLPIQNFTLYRDQDQVRGVGGFATSFSKDQPNQITLWDYPTWHVQLQQDAGHVTRMIQHGPFIIFGFNNGILALLIGDSPRFLNNLAPENRLMAGKTIVSLASVTINRENLLLAGAYDGTITLSKLGWDADYRMVVEGRSEIHHPSQLGALGIVHYIADQHLIMSVGHDLLVCFWNPDTGQLHHQQQLTIPNLHIIGLLKSASPPQLLALVAPNTLFRIPMSL